MLAGSAPHDDRAGLDHRTDENSIRHASVTFGAGAKLTDSPTLSPRDLGTFVADGTVFASVGHAFI
jgi:hypothetical protein